MTNDIRSALPGRIGAGTSYLQCAFAAAAGTAGFGAVGQWLHERNSLPVGTTVHSSYAQIMSRVGTLLDATTTSALTPIALTAVAGVIAAVAVATGHMRAVYGLWATFAVAAAAVLGVFTTSFVTTVITHQQPLPADPRQPALWLLAGVGVVLLAALTRRTIGAAKAATDSPEGQS